MSKAHPTSSITLHRLHQREGARRVTCLGLPCWPSRQNSRVELALCPTAENLERGRCSAPHNLVTPSHRFDLPPEQVSGPLRPACVLSPAHLNVHVTTVASRGPSAPSPAPWAAMRPCGLIASGVGGRGALAVGDPVSFEPRASARGPLAGLQAWVCLLGVQRSV